MILLSKDNKVSLSKPQGSGLGTISVNLNWNTQGINTQGIDLDLGCLVELKDNRKGAVQALGSSFGNYDKPPYIMLDGDDRTGASSSGETIRINGNQIKQIKRLLLYAFIYEGVVNWRDAAATVTIKYPKAEDIVIKMDEFNTNLGICGLALFQNIRDQTFSIQRIMRFYPSHRDLDKAFGWGIKWKSGRK